MRERPKPEMAPYRPAAEVVRQKDRKKPIQLNRNATGQKRPNRGSDMSLKKSTDSRTEVKRDK